MPAYRSFTQEAACLSLLALLGGCMTKPAFRSAQPDEQALPASFPPAGSSGTSDPDGSVAAPASNLPGGIQESLAETTGRYIERGLASWYGPRFHGRRTASGERYDMHALTAAHKTLPFGTRVQVHSLRTGREVEVRINDRGPFISGRVIDISRAAAKALGFSGIDEVLLKVVVAPPLKEQSASTRK